MATFTEVVKTLLEKLVSFFDIFDLSFFISGALALAAISFHLHMLDAAQADSHREAVRARAQAHAVAERQFEQAKTRIDDAKARIKEAQSQRLALVEKPESPQVGYWQKEEDAARSDYGRAEESAAKAAGEVASIGAERGALDSPESLLETFVTGINPLLLFAGVYVLGLLCHALARVWPRKLRSKLMELSANSGAEDREPFRSFLALKSPDGDQVRLFRARLWAWLRESGRPSYQYVLRFWVRAAIYDGLATALIFIAFAALCWTGFAAFRGDWITAVPAAAGVAFAIWVGRSCWREAGAIASTQDEEIVAGVSEDVRRRDGQEVSVKRTTTIAEKPQVVTEVTAKVYDPEANWLRSEPTPPVAATVASAPKQKPAAKTGDAGKGTVCTRVQTELDVETFLTSVADPRCTVLIFGGARSDHDHAVFQAAGDVAGAGDHRCVFVINDRALVAMHVGDDWQVGPGQYTLIAGADRVVARVGDTGAFRVQGEVSFSQLMEAFEFGGRIA